MTGMVEKRVKMEKMKVEMGSNRCQALYSVTSSRYSPGLPTRKITRALMTTPTLIIISAV